MNAHSTLKSFFEVATPATLISLIRDIDDLGTGAELEQQELKAKAKVTLVSNVGEIEFARMYAGLNCPMLTIGFGDDQTPF